MLVDRFDSSRNALPVETVNATTTYEAVIIFTRHVVAKGCDVKVWMVNEGSGE